MKFSGVIAKTSLATAICLLAFGTASAATVTVGNATASPGGGATTPGTIPFTYTADGETVGYQCDIVTPAGITASTATGNCAVLGSGNVRVSIGTPDNSILPSGTHCQIAYTVGATAVDGDTFPLALTGCLYSDADGNPSTATPVQNAGLITVQAAPPDVVLGFAPASAVAFPGGTSGTSTTASIAVSVASGSIGTGTVSNCVVGGTNASAFSVTAGVPATVPPAGNIDLSVTLANAALAATLTCNVADAGAATTHTWNLTAPAGTPVPAPGYSSNPAPGAAIDRTGIPGSSCNSSVVITNNGFAGAGSDLTYNCSVAGADFTIASGASGTVAVGSSATVSVAVACPADGTTVTDTLSCTTNDPAVAEPSYNLSATGQAFVAPTFVPASSLWSKLALFGIFAALGMLVLGLRRNH